MINPVFMGRVMIDGSGSDVGCWIVTIEASYMLSSSSARVSNDKIGIHLEYIKCVCILL